MSRHDPLITLQQMKSNCKEIINLSRGKDKNEIESNRLLCLAIVRLLEMLGEAANRVPEDIREENPDIPWIQIIGLRNRLIHGYDDIDLDVIWMIIVQDLPSLCTKLENLLA